ncbi:hypothetical protein BamIOP4010DRAFT_5580 [Burkholderia ambifaria IOP40-10]|uniref:Uncharacterized protein n=1 Tax=Burkholderia ambifaria IOP40-10 TaxID=396596 RepID=B1FNG9_9BURK|nr:hypothetical protein BamIOP4010DRAFT_5580 [Burkholderia ambifaria IOP40-10]
MPTIAIGSGVPVSRGATAGAAGRDGTACVGAGLAFGAVGDDCSARKSARALTVG